MTTKIDNPVRFWRLYANLTVKEMSEKTGMSRWTYAERENNPDSFTIAEAKIVSQLLNQPLETLFCCNETLQM